MIVDRCSPFHQFGGSKSGESSWCGPVGFHATLPTGLFLHGGSEVLEGVLCVIRDMIGDSWLDAFVGVAFGSLLVLVMVLMVVLDPD